MKLSKHIAIMIAAGACTLIVACGGGSSTEPTTTTPPPTGGISGNGIAIGPISNFGSIIVNGVVYDTSSATFTINEVPGGQADLSVGHVVTVTGTIDSNGTTGTANTVLFEDIVKGPVESIDLATNRLTVLGQLVLVSPDTSFDDSFIPASLDGVSVAQIVEVSGQFDANGDIVATRIEPKPAGTQFEVHGTVNSLDTTNLLFNLSNLVVDYSMATLEFPSGMITEGDFVEAKGMTLSPLGELEATKVELELRIPDTNNGDLVEVEGFITRFVSSQDFDVAGIPVITNGNTQFVGGTANDLGLNIKVEVEGSIDANGSVTAARVDIRRSKAVRVTADVDSVGANSLVLLGIPVSIDALTRLEDKSSADLDPLNFTDINVGDYLEIRGAEFPAGSGTIQATILEREDSDAEAILQGFVETIGSTSYTVLGVTIETDGATIFRDENDTVISATDFFNTLTVNALVKAEGAEVTDTTIAATEVEFELEF